MEETEAQRQSSRPDTRISLAGAAGEQGGEAEGQQRPLVGVGGVPEEGQPHLRKPGVRFLPAVQGLPGETPTEPGGPAGRDSARTPSRTGSSASSPGTLGTSRSSPGCRSAQPAADTAASPGPSLQSSRRKG